MARVKKTYEILIVEDEYEIAEIIKTYLQLYPKFKKVVIAKNSLEASQKLSNQPFDLVVSDIQLDRRTAIEFIERVKKQPKYFNLKFMVVSGCLTQDITLKLMKLGVRNIVVKPFTARQILINAISVLGIEKKPQKTVNSLILKVKERLSSKKDELEQAIPDDEISKMIKNSKGIK